MGDALVAQHQIQLRGSGARHHELADAPLHPALDPGVLFGILGADPFQLGSKDPPPSGVARGKAREQQRVLDLVMEAQAPVVERGEGEQAAHEPRHRTRLQVDGKDLPALHDGDFLLPGTREDVGGEGALPAPGSTGELDDRAAVRDRQRLT